MLKVKLAAFVFAGDVVPRRSRRSLSRQDAVDAAKAKAEGKVAWYTSTPIEQAQKILEAVQEADRHQGRDCSVPAAHTILSRFQQETTAGRDAADVLTHSDPAAARALTKQGHVHSVQAEEFRQDP